MFSIMNCTDKVFYHLLCHFEIGDHAIFKGLIAWMLLWVRPTYVLLVPTAKITIYVPALQLLKVRLQLRHAANVNEGIRSTQIYRHIS